MANLTIRIDDKLKRDAEEACKRLDLTMSQVIRRALKALVKDSGSRFDPIESVNLLDREEEWVIQEAAMKSASLARKKRIDELTQKERRNELNKVTRAELSRLRLEQAAEPR